MKFLIVQFTDTESIAIPLASTSDAQPALKIVEADVDYPRDGFRKVFELIPTAQPVELTRELFDHVACCLYNTICELNESGADT